MTAGELEGISGEPGVLYDDDVDVAYTDDTSVMAPASSLRAVSKSQDAGAVVAAVICAAIARFRRPRPSLKGRL